MPRKYVKKTDREYTPHKPRAVAAFRVGFLAALDARTALARALKDRFLAIAADLGGIDNLSTIKVSLLEQYVFLEAVQRRLADEIGKATDAKAVAEIQSRWTQGLNSLIGLAKTLGLDRKATAMPWTVLEPAKTNGHANGKTANGNLPNGLRELDAESADADKLRDANADLEDK